MIKSTGKSNLLKELHHDFIELPKSFRLEVCAECSWSEATFYRKAKGKNTFSNAEKDKIKTVAKSLLETVNSKIVQPEN